MRSKIIIVGTGLAGMVAAYEAQNEGAEVVLVDRGPIGIGTNSSLANGVFAAPMHYSSSDTYIQETCETGRHINNQSVVKLIAEKAPGAFQLLRLLNLNVRETSNQHIVESSLPGVIPGVVMMKKLVETLKKLDRINVIRGLYITEIMHEKNHVCGVKGINKKGEEISLQSSVVVLATGGAGAIYLRNDNQKKTMGQGYYLAAKAGLQLLDMEFIQFYPLVLAEPHLSQMLVYPPYPKEAKLINAGGEDIIKKYNLEDINVAIRKKRDEISAWLFAESVAGNVKMDFRDVPDHLWETHPLSLLKKINFDFRSKPFAVSPAAHFFMGGVRTDGNGQTDVNGLYACGEIVWGLHGANRMSGNALTECIVTGKIVGHHAAHSCRKFPKVSLPYEEMLTAAVPQQPRLKEGLNEILRTIRETAWNHAGIVRSRKSMQDGLTKVEEIKRQLSGITPKNPAEKILSKDLASAVFTLQAILTAGIGRRETRGSFIRKDFPHEDNVNWRKNSCLRYHTGNEGFSVDYNPVSSNT
ncbi:MAG TPA: FAD-dependent oxidoreductase [Syntrophales bacterium]|nr:FAD-dependent oxidoreductase [Syntrophales bacterium]